MESTDLRQFFSRFALNPHDDENFIQENLYVQMIREAEKHGEKFLDFVKRSVHHADGRYFIKFPSWKYLEGSYRRGPTVKPIKNPDYIEDNVTSSEEDEDESDPDDCSSDEDQDDYEEDDCFSDGSL